MPLHQVPELIDRNRTVFRSEHLSVAGSPLSKLRSQIKEHLDLGKVVVASGHQPTFYGPGPFCKELILDKLCDEFSELNLLVDTDGTSQISLDIPLNRNGAYLFQELVVKEFNQERAYCSLSPPNEQEFTGMKEKTLARLSTLRSDQYYKQAAGLFAEASSKHMETSSYVDWFSAFKALYYRGSYQELLFSDIIQLASFQKFVPEISHNYERFRAIYNDVLNNYRQQQGSLPATVLEPNEAPFWVIDAQGTRETASLNDIRKALATPDRTLPRA